MGGLRCARRQILEVLRGPRFSRIRRERPAFGERQAGPEVEDVAQQQFRRQKHDQRQENPQKDLPTSRHSARAPDSEGSGRLSSKKTIFTPIIEPADPFGTRIMLIDIDVEIASGCPVGFSMMRFK